MGEYLCKLGEGTDFFWKALAINEKNWWIDFIKIKYAFSSKDIVKRMESHRCERIFPIHIYDGKIISVLFSACEFYLNKNIHFWYIKDFNVEK